MIKKSLILLLLMVFVTFVILYFIEKFSFPVTYKVCNFEYKDCHAIAKFHDRDSCERTNKEWGWYCDQTDKNNIKCQEKESNVSTGFCD